MILGLVVVLAAGPPPCADLRLTAGQSWTYQAQVAWSVAGGMTRNDTTLTWTTRVLTVRARDSVQVAEVENWPTALAWWEPGQPPDTSLVICTASRAYHLSATGAFRTAIADSLLAGERHPSLDALFLQLPLHSGDLFGREPSERPDNFYAWYVDSAAPVSAQLAGLGAQPQDSVYTLIYRTLPDHQIIDYAPGVGIARYVYGHHGTVAEASAVLVAIRRPP